MGVLGMSWRVAGVGVGVGALLAWWAWRRAYIYPDTPFKWEEVGEVSELIIYPLKSARGIKVTEAMATRYGLAHDLLEDRSFVAITSKGNIVRGKFDPKIFTVSLTFDGSMVTLRAREEEEELQFDLQDVIRAGKVVEITKTMKGYDCGDEASAWLTRVVQVKKEKLRLVYNGDLTTDEVPGVKDTLLYFDCTSDVTVANVYTNTRFKPSDRTVYSQLSAYMLASETSLADLNGRMLKPVTMDWFRPNLVVRGVREAYDEDDWAFVKIGDVVLRCVEHCTKFVFRYVDPDTGIRHTDDDDDLLKKTLASTGRQVFPEDLQYKWNRTPPFGTHLGIDTCGKVRVGDKVLVARVSSNPRWQFYQKKLEFVEDLKAYRKEKGFEMR